MVDPVAEDMQVLEVPVDRRDLGCRHHAHAVDRARRERLVDAVDGVVVGQREQVYARPGGVLDYLGSRQLAVRMQRMRLEIESGDVHGGQHIRG